MNRRWARMWSSERSVRMLAEEAEWPALTFVSKYRFFLPALGNAVRWQDNADTHTIPGGEPAWDDWLKSMAVIKKSQPEQSQMALKAAHRQLRQLAAGA